MVKKHNLSEGTEEVLFLEDNIPKDFEDLDRTFRCSICASLFDKAVTIKECGHTFCSVCIRNYWVAIRNGVHRQEKSCPICRTTVKVMDVEKALVMNRSIQESVKAFKQMLLIHHRSSNDQIEGSKRKRRSSKRTSSETGDENKFCHEDENDSCGNDSNKRNNEIPVQKRMQSRNYDRMKRKDLQNLCKELTIPTTGTEQELANRLRNYQNMWNAEVMHSIEPKKPSDIAAKLKKEEQAQREEKRRAKMNGSANVSECIRKLHASMRSDDRKCTSGNATFDRVVKSNFKNLTDQLKLRMNKKQASTTIVADTLSYVDKSVDEASTTQLSSEMAERASAPDASCIEYIDVEFCPDEFDSSMNPLPSLQPTSSSGKKRTSFDSNESCRNLSSSNTKSTTRVQNGQRSIATRSLKKKK
eukprot:CAMPEP_0197190686 /NCGR_PEP_ID=MMETSP1423-20130617/22150_1 /TAXON_ID=476441 /ORGANISM="Pseudo-nitzschia heimii, Strain UNC1101" /LENGTH=414 /DNA_ID=CAMNT_0042643133 /DNA_START=268 /DNA_END=1509 /DNA_ORIENTATION=+